MSKPSNLKSTVNVDIPKNSDPNAVRRTQVIIADTYSFIRSMEANKAISAVTLEELISDQIKRNGTSDEAKNSQFTPYEYSTDSEKPAGLKAQQRVLSVGGSDVGRPSKMERLLALKNVLISTIDALKNIDPLSLSNEEVYADASLDAIEDSEEL